MKTKIPKKTLSFCLAGLMTLTISVQCFASSTPFKDLDAISAKDKILTLQKEGYVNGISDGEFAPAKNVTAAEGVQLIVNALNLNLDTVKFIKEPKATDYFSKANNDAWYANALIIASVNSLDLQSDMDPNMEWTREEFTYHLIQAMEKHNNLPMINIIPADIADNNQINISYSGAIQRALVYKIVSLDSNKCFNPTSKISRADAAAEVYNALEYIKTISK
jgi:S-layer homology domain.